jgi:hypothetical protein
MFAAVLGTDGRVWAWGNDDQGQLGNARTSTPVTRPVNAIGAGSGITQISAGGDLMLALKSNVRLRGPRAAAQPGAVGGTGDRACSADRVAAVADGAGAHVGNRARSRGRWRDSPARAARTARGERHQQGRRNPEWLSASWLPPAQHGPEGAQETHSSG